jgi:GDSL-like Lipase/Acylhydrolase
MVLTGTLWQYKHQSKLPVPYPLHLIKMSFVYKHKHSELLFILILIFQYHTQIIRADVSAVIVFGDSTVDSGNNDFIETIGKSNFRPYGQDFYGGQPTGRFSNGRLPTDFISEAFRLPPIVPAFLDPSYTVEHFATGVCFASAFTGWDDVTADIFVSSMNNNLNILYICMLS